MKWNREERECQIHIGVDCSGFTTKSLPSEQIVEAANILEAGQRGWTTEEEAKQKILDLPEVKRGCRALFYSEMEIEIYSAHRLKVDNLR